METIKYYKIYRMGGKRYILRQELVRIAKSKGIKAAGRLCGCSRNTVRKWLRRHKADESDALLSKSTRPHHCPHQTPAAVEALVVRYRHRTGYGAERLKREFNLPCGVSAIQRILRQRQLVRPRKKKHKTKRILREIKQNWKLFGHLSADTKYLCDIPNYWWFMKHLRLPLFQYTVREIVSGLTFVGYADDRSQSYAVLMAKLVSFHLARCGVSLRQVEWQTDNGSEFKENLHERGFPSTVRSFGSGHHYIPPKAHTWQSDIETVHSLEETEFFDREKFASPTDFWEKVNSYWLHFNLTRKNRNKGWRSPLQIIQEKDPSISPAIASLLPLDLARVHDLYVPHRSPQRGHDLPIYPFLFTTNY